MFVPAQYACSGAVQVLVAVLVVAVVVLVPAILVYRDAGKPGTSAALWGFVVGVRLLFGLLAGLAAIARKRDGDAATARSG